MSMTSLELPDDLQQRVASAARALGLSPHAFMVDAIRQAVHTLEQRSSFVAQAREAQAEMRQDGLGHDAGEVYAYLRQRLGDGQADPKTMARMR